MALTESKEFTLGTKAIDFKLFNTVDNKFASLNNLKGTKGTVIMFICNHCPFVIYVNKRLVEISLEYQKKGINFIGISSNDAEKYPDDSPELMSQNAKKNNYPFPYLYDETQEIAKAYDAACTPEFYVFDSNLKSVYHGRLDDSRPGNGIPVTGKDLILSLENLLADKPAIKNQKPSMGCGIKWK